MDKKAAKKEPDKLYRYRRTGKSLAYLLAEIKGSMWRATPETLNDPFDGLTLVEPEDGEIVYHGEGEPIHVPIKRSWLVACFSEKWENPPMWAHYSKYTGVCLVYDLKKLKSYVNAGDIIGLPGLGMGYKRRLEKVIYRTKLPNTNDPNKALMRKTIDWSYEKEWRIVVQTNAEEGTGRLISAKDSLTEILLGPNLDERTKRKIVAVRNSLNHKVEIYQVKIVPGKSGYDRKILE